MCQLTSGEDTDRWFVTTTETEAYNVEDVGAAKCEIVLSGSLIFRDAEGRITFAYAPGTWTFVEYQD